MYIPIFIGKAVCKRHLSLFLGPDSGQNAVQYKKIGLQCALVIAERWRRS